MDPQAIPQPLTLPDHNIDTHQRRHQFVTNAPLIVISLEGLTPSALGCYGSSWNETPTIDRLASNDPDIRIFGPSTVTSVTGVRQPNPLSRRERFRFATRGEGQELLPAVHQLGLRMTKSVSVGGSRSVEVTGSILNLLNGGNGFEFARGGANRSYAGPTIFLQPGNIQPPRSYQLAVEYRF